MNGFVLLVDDSLTVRRILEICLRQASCKVKSFEDDVQALVCLAQYAPGAHS